MATHLGGRCSKVSHSLTSNAKHVANLSHSLACEVAAMSQLTPTYLLYSRQKSLKSKIMVGSVTADNVMIGDTTFNI